MRVFTSIASVFFIFSSSALAQEPNRSRGQGYFFFALGGGTIGPQGHQYQPDIHVGAGGEGFIYKGLGVGAELGPVGPTKNCSYSGGQCPLGWFAWAFGLGSANFSYHFLPSTIDRKFEPFVTAGYSMFFHHGVFNGYNVGGGINVWMTKNAALRFEGRFHSTGIDAVYVNQFAGFRVGMTFR
jgi:hypothetical protein